MKRLLTVYIVILVALFASSKSLTFAAASPTPSPSDQAIQQQLDLLKSRIASRVAELKLVEKRGIIGKVTSSNDTQITLTDIYGNTRFVDVDELTKFSNPDVKGNASFGISDITNGMQLGVLGLFNKQSRRILARDVEVITLPKTFTGAIAGIDKKNFNFYLASEDGKQTFMDIETVTKTYSYTGGTLGTSGFSKITEGEMAIIQGFPDKQNPSHIIPSIIILLPDIARSPKINYVPALNPQASAIPSTGSGVRLTPITK